MLGVEPEDDGVGLGEQAHALVEVLGENAGAVVAEGGLDGGLEAGPGPYYLVESGALARRLGGPQAAHPRLGPAHRRGQLPAPAAHALRARLHAPEGPAGLDLQVPGAVAGPVVRQGFDLPNGASQAAQLLLGEAPHLAPGGEVVRPRAEPVELGGHTRPFPGGLRALPAGEVRLPLPVAGFRFRRVAFGC